MITEADLPTEADLGMLAGKIAERLTACVVSASLPAWAGEWIRETASHGCYVWTYTVPMNPGGTALGIHIQLNPDGTLNLEFRDTNGCPFWRGTFRPEAKDANADDR